MTTPTPKWFKPICISALLWNLLGCAAYLADVMQTPDDIAQMSAAQQALYASRPAWLVAATAIAVWGGFGGSFRLLLRKRWATHLLVASLVGVVVQDVGLFLLTDAGQQAGPAALVLQSLVLLIAVGLVFLGRKATAEGWIR